jgi:hypothetical protein
MQFSLGCGAAAAVCSLVFSDVNLLFNTAALCPKSGQICMK